MTEESKFTLILKIPTVLRLGPTVLRLGAVIALAIFLFDVLSLTQDVDFESMTSTELVFTLYKSVGEDAIAALTFLVTGLIASLISIVRFLFLTDPVLAVSVTFLLLVFVMELISGLSSQQNELAVQCDTLVYKFAYNFSTTKLVFAMSVGVVIKGKVKLKSRNRAGSNPK